MTNLGNSVFKMLVVVILFVVYIVGLGSMTSGVEFVDGDKLDFKGWYK